MGEPGDGLSVEQTVGQLFAVGFAGATASAEVLDLIARRHVGSVILFSRNLRSAEQTLALTTALQQAARDAGHPVPLLIMTDQEGGLVRRLGPDSTTFPGNMALGATGSEALTYEVARASGRELAAQGINVNLAPVVDVNSNPDNPVIGVRSYGEDSALVARLGVAATNGYRAGGVFPVLKHFPGHGDTATDSHLALPVLAATRERLERAELLPFREGIARGAECVLVAHVAVPSLAASPSEAQALLPASLSPLAIQGLLRDELGFAGVVMTDCLEMNAVAEGVGVARGAVLALNAGNDLVLVSHRAERQHAALDAALAALDSGELAQARVVEAAERVLRLKRRLLAWDGLPTEAGLGVVGSEVHRAVAAHAFAASTTLIRDRAGLVPLRLVPGARLLVTLLLPRAVTMASDSVVDGAAFLATLQRLHPATTLARVASGDESALTEALAAATTADTVLLVTINAHADEQQRQAAERIAAASRRVVGIAACDPYDASALPSVGTFLASYEYSAPALAAALDVLFGVRPATGRLPVTV